MYGSQMKSPSIAPQPTPDRAAVPETISPKVQELDLEELWQANRLLNNSSCLHYLLRMQELLEEGYRFNSLEQRIFDKFVETYNIQYKSPLAEAMKED